MPIPPTERIIYAGDDGAEDGRTPVKRITTLQISETQSSRHASLSGLFLLGASPLVSAVEYEVPCLVSEVSRYPVRPVEFLQDELR